MLEIRNAVKVFAPGTPNAYRALDGLNLCLARGEFVTVIGSNGAGKSTLFNAICGNFWLDQGHIVLDGKDISYCSVHRRARTIGRIFQDPMKGTAPSLTIEENLALAYSRNKRGSLGVAVTKRTTYVPGGLGRLSHGIRGTDEHQSRAFVRGAASGSHLADGNYRSPKAFAVG